MSIRAIFTAATIAVVLVCSPAVAKNVKVDVCHLTGNDSYHVINVSENAADAHLAHGDWLVTDEVCGDEIDNDCDGEVDEDCCPCYAREDLDAYWPNNDPIWAFCWDNTFDNGNYMHDRLRGWGYEYESYDHQGFLSVFAEQWGGNGEGPSDYYCYFEAWFRDFVTGEEFDEFYSMYTTADEYASCDAILAEFLEDSGLDCEETHVP